MSRNIAHHIETVLKDKPAGFRPLIHCWRGGQRSRAFALVLSEVGWTTHLLAGGYKAYRRDILDRLKDMPLRLKLQIIAGRTGSGKTALLGICSKKEPRFWIRKNWPLIVALFWARSPAALSQASVCLKAI